MSQSIKEIQDLVKSFIKKGEISLAIERLYDHSLTLDKHFSEEILLIIQRFEQVKRKNKVGLISEQDYQIEHN